MTPARRRAPQCPQAPARSEPPTAAAGRLAEAAAARFLEARGWRIIARNVRRRGGEIDLVAVDGGTLAFVEVRARRTAWGLAGIELAAASVGRAKQQRIRRAAGAFLVRWPQWAGWPARYDVVLVELDGRGQAVRLQHLPGAF